MSVDTVWQEALHYIQGKVPKQVYDAWFTPVHLDRIENSTAHIGVPNKFFGDWLGNHYGPLLAEAVSSARGGGEMTVSFSVSQKTSKPAEAPAVPPTVKSQAQTKSRRGIQLNPKYTFKNFVVGAGNQFAHAACMAVAEQPGKAYNPLFIYGGVGLGKTHLLNAIGNRIAQNDHSAKVCYISSEKFTNELINCLRYEKMTDFRNKYRNKDALLVDDIQFLGGKERTQEEFFHTFNSLYESHRQIVITSDKLAKEIGGLEERLRSRISWGLIADIQPPDIETKVAILCKKAELFNISLSNEVGLFLASNLGTNIRELEGALTRLRAYSSLTGSDINEAMAKETLKDILSDRQKMISIDNIQKNVASLYNISIS